MFDVLRRSFFASMFSSHNHFPYGNQKLHRTAFVVVIAYISSVFCFSFCSRDDVEYVLALECFHTVQYCFLFIMIDNIFFKMQFSMIMKPLFFLGLFSNAGSTVT